MGAYSRDPGALFLQRLHRHRSPLNREAQQPVLYRDVTLRACLGTAYDPGDTLDFVAVNWRTGVAEVFLDAEDALNKVPFVTVIDALPPCQPRSARDYVREAEAFAMRGHSLGSADCRCLHGLANDRALELGITTDDERCATCPLDSTPRSFDAAELSRELGLHDVITATSAEGWSVWDVLCFRGTLLMQPLGGSVQISAKQVHVGGLHSKADLVRAVETAKYTFRVPDHDCYPGMRRDVAELVSEGRAWALYDGALMYRRDTSTELQLDPDVRRAWHHPDACRAMQ